MKNKLALRLPVIIQDSEVIPLYFSDSDRPWLMRLMFQLKRYENQPQNLIQQNQLIYDLKLPYKKGKFALEKLIQEITLIPKSSIEIHYDRNALFEVACQVRKKMSQQDSNTSWNRSNFLKQVIVQLGYPDMSKEQLMAFIEDLFKDLVKIPIIQNVESLGELKEMTYLLNLWLIKKIMSHSFMVEIIIKDQCRRLVRQAKLRGLICEVEKISTPYLKLRISGPLSLFGPTRIYGKKFVEFIPLLFWNWEFKLRAVFKELDHSYFLYLDSNAPIKVAKQPELFDSKLESQFYNDFIKLSSDWELLREPEMITVGTKAFFVDFVAYNKINKKNSRQTHEGILIEIVGYWTADYLKKKVSEISFYKNRKAIFIFNEKYKSIILSELKLDHQKHRLYFFKRKILIEPILEKLDELLII